MPYTSSGSTSTISQAPAVNFIAVVTSAATKVSNAPKPLSAIRHPPPPRRRQCTTMPA
ncbi:hypothetical protein [Nocardia wallacei]|nr:hypothetical protein [Nocardia wallacei]